MMMTRRTLLHASMGHILSGQQPGKTTMFGNAESYERFMGRWSRLVAERLVDFAQLPERGHVLDIGSGTGSLAFEIARQKSGVRVTGIDPSGEYVAYATAQTRYGERTIFRTGDAQAMPFGDAEFDGCASLLVFNFIPDPAKALREARRVTRVGGPVSAAVWDYGGQMRMLRVFWDAAVSLDAAAEKLDEKHMRLCRAGELETLWKEAGLQNIREQPLDIEMRFASFDDFWAPFLLGQGPAGAYVRSLDEAGVRALRGAVKQRLGVESEGRAFSLEGRVWAVRGRAS
jgi:ubiquinone/menaquinone biosynthesis C-methylase UbiE